MTKQEKIELAELLKVLSDLDRLADCSDRFFRQVFAQRAGGGITGRAGAFFIFKANGYIDKLLAEAGEEGRD